MVIEGEGKCKEARERELNETKKITWKKWKVEKEMKNSQSVPREYIWDTEILRLRVQTSRPSPTSPSVAQSTQQRRTKPRSTQSVG